MISYTRIGFHTLALASVGFCARENRGTRRRRRENQFGFPPQWDTEMAKGGYSDTFLEGFNKCGFSKEYLGIIMEIGDNANGKEQINLPELPDATPEVPEDDEPLTPASLTGNVEELLQKKKKLTRPTNLRGIIVPFLNTKALDMNKEVRRRIKDELMEMEGLEIELDGEIAHGFTDELFLKTIEKPKQETEAQKQAKDGVKKLGLAFQLKQEIEAASREILDKKFGTWRITRKYRGSTTEIITMAYQETVYKLLTQDVSIIDNEDQSIIFVSKQINKKEVTEAFANGVHEPLRAIVDLYCHAVLKVNDAYNLTKHLHRWQDNCLEDRLERMVLARWLTRNGRGSNTMIVGGPGYESWRMGLADIPEEAAGAAPDSSAGAAPDNHDDEPVGAVPVPGTN